MTKTRFLIVICLFLLTSVGTNGQTTESNIAQFKEQIQKLVAVDQSDSTPAEVKELNRRFIREKRIQLRALLQDNVAALQRYLTSVGAALDESQKLVVKNRIHDVENDLQVVQTQIDQVSSSVTASNSSGPRVTTPPVADGDGDGSSDGRVTNGSASPAAPTGMASPTIAGGASPNPPQDSTSLNATLNARIRSKARIDQTDNTKQTETPSMSSNSTSLVDQSSASDLIGIATNLAGLSGHSNDTQPDASSVSVTTSAYALLAAVNRVDPLNPVFYNQHRAWRSFSVTLGYDDEDQPNGTRQRTKLFGAKYLFINRRDPNLARNRQYVDTVTRSLEAAALEFGDLSVRVRGFAFSLDTVRKNLLLPGFTKFLEKRKLEKELALERKRNELAAAAVGDQPEIQKQIAALESDLTRINGLQHAAPDELLVLASNHLPAWSWTREEKEYQVQFLNEYFGADYRTKLGKDVTDKIDRFIDQQLNDAELVAFRNLNSDARDAVERLRRAPQLSLSFLTKQRKFGFDEYAGELIFDYGVANRINLSLNGAYHYQDSKIIGSDARGFSFAGQLQFQLNRENLLGKKPFFFDLSTQGNWMTGTDAIYKAQGKFTIPLADGIDFPISVTYANRTDLIKEHDVRGQFGFTLDTARLIRAFVFR